MNQEKQDDDRSTGPDDRWVASMRAWEAMRSPWAKERPAFVRCYVCHPENDEIDPEDGLRPSQLRPIHKCTYVDPGQEQYLRATAEQLREKKDEDVHEWPEPGYDFATGLRRKPASSSMHETDNAAREPTHAEQEDDDMKLTKAALAVAIAVTASSSLAEDIAESRAPTSPTVLASRSKSEGEPNPVWPDNGVAQRELGDGEDSPESLFVEHVGDKWFAWALIATKDGPTKAVDFFTGEIVEVTAETQLGDTGSFTDAKGIKHEETTHSGFHYKDPRPGGVLGDIRFADRSVDRPETFRSGPIWFDTYQRMADDDATVIWSKVPFYECNDSGQKHWDTLFGTALDLNDGTMLVSAGKYIFRLRQDDFSPVGRAPALHIVDEAELLRVLDEAKGKDIEDGDAWLTEKLNLK